MDTAGFNEGMGGVCKRYPPQSGVINDEPNDRWPCVSATDWCGEWHETVEVERARRLEQIRKNMDAMCKYPAPGTTD